MRVNLHRNPIYLYIYINELDALRKISLFEDFDETFINFNIEAKKKTTVLLKKDEVFLKNIETKKKIKIKSFYKEFFFNS